MGVEKRIFAQCFAEEKKTVSIKVYYYFIGFTICRADAIFQHCILSRMPKSNSIWKMLMKNEERITKKKHEELWLCIETQSRNETQCTIVIQHLHCLLSIRDTRFPFNPHIEMSSFHFLSFVLIKQHHTTASIVQYEPKKKSEFELAKSMA